MAISKVKLPNNTTEDVHDSRIAGIDNAPTSGSNNPVSSGGVYTALQNVTPEGVEVTSNKVTSISSSSTDTQYPSAKCMYDIVGDIELALDIIINGYTT